MFSEATHCRVAKIGYRNLERIPMFSEATHRALETLFSLALLIAFLFVVVASIGCGGEAAATTQKIVIFQKPAPPPMEEAIATVPPPAVLKDVVFPPKAAIKLDANTYRACTCGDVCTCATCPVDCNTLAANDCPGGVCRIQRSVIAKSSPVQASGDCSSGPVRSRAKAVGGKVLGGVKAVGRFVLRPLRR